MRISPRRDCRPGRHGGICKHVSWASDMSSLLTIPFVSGFFLLPCTLSNLASTRTCDRSAYCRKTTEWVLRHRLGRDTRLQIIHHRGTESHPHPYDGHLAAHCIAQTPGDPTASYFIYYLRQLLSVTTSHRHNERIILQGGPKKWYPSIIFAITSVNVHRF